MKKRKNQKVLALIMAILLVLPILSGIMPVLAAGTPVMKTFDQLTEDEKVTVLNKLIADNVIPNRVTVGGGWYSLNLTLWKTKGIIAYGETAAINAIHQHTTSPNYKNGQYRYWGYDMNGGLYGNDDFPRDSDSGTPAYEKAWLTTIQIAGNGTAANYIGGFALTDRFSTSKKRATANAFLSENPQWLASGKDANYILEHFFFNSVLDDSGLTQGQFIGVHKSKYDGGLYYQTFSVSGEIVWYEVPSEDEIPDIPELPDPEEPVIPEPEPGSSVSAACSLHLPTVTYKGHPTIAEDNSTFLVDGEQYSALTAYAKGYASNTFKSNDASVRKISDTRARVTFSTTGMKSVTLTVKPKGGTQVSDTKSIEVRKTPTIIHNVTGPLKQNRKNTLNVQVAKNPSASLVELWIKIEHPETGESVTLKHNFNGTPNTLSNGETIKTRPIVEGESDELFFNCSLDFLTKNTANTDYAYTIYVKDSLGNFDEVTTGIPMAQDAPPEVHVLLQSYYIRNEDSNFAEVIAEDGSVTDGDQIQRTWYYKEEGSSTWIAVEGTDGYSDYSFGTNKKIGFQKEGVGQVEVRLVAKDVWVEETMPEYITSSEYLTAESVSLCEVINVAPLISLEAITPKTAEITILTGGTHEYDRVNENLNRLQQELLRKGINARITIEKMAPAASDSGGQAISRTATISTPFGYEGNWTFYENDNYIVDDERLYKIDASWPSTDLSGYPESPYTISCWDWNAAQGDKRWTYTFTDALLTVPSTRNGPYFAQDDTGRYLYFVANGKTLILTKDNGSYLTLLNMEVGKNCFVEKDQIYTFKEDGIYRISTLTGQIQKVYNGSIMSGTARRIGGQVHFVVYNGNTMHRGLFDPENESISLESLPAQSYGFGAATHTLLGIDAEGKLMILTVLRQRYASGELMDTYIKNVRIYDRSNKMVYLSPGHANSSNAAISGINPVYDEGGVCKYLAFTWDGRSSSYRNVHARVLGIFDGFDLSYYIRKSGSDYPSCGDKVPFVREVDGKVFVTTGAEWVYVYNMGYGIYQERLKLFVFDPESGTAREGDVNEIGIPISTVENGRSSDVLSAVQVGYNTPGGGESINYILKWNQSLPQILNRYISKNLKAEKDINALIVYDETNPASLYTSDLMSSLDSRLLAKNGKFIMATRAQIESGGLGEAILSLGDEDKNLLGVSVAEGKVGTLSKSYDLDPNTTYYYEYEIKDSNGSSGDVLNVTHNTALPPGAQFDSAGYRTVASYSDDFENAENTNPFFNYASVEVSRYSGMEKVISEGYYKGADLRHKRSSGNGYYADPYQPETTAITFTVPEGKKGLLSFDYLLEKANAYGGGNSAWTQSYVKIDGKLWDACVPNSGTGHYSHPALLEPGEHVITFCASEYGREITAKMWLDSIQVDLLEAVQGGLPASDKESLTAEPLSGGYVRIKGSFKTLPQIATYGEIKNATVIDGSIGSVPYTVWTNTDPDRRAFNFDIPVGKTAIFTQVSTLSVPRWSNDRNESVTYTLPLYYMNKESGWINHRWTALAKNRYPEDAMRNWDNNGVLIPGELDGLKTFSLTASAYRHTSGNFTNITSVIVDNAHKSWGNLNYFLTGSKDSKKFFLQKDQYKDTKVALHLDEGDYNIRNFKIYSLHNGMRVYAEKESFSNSAVFSEWNVHQAEASIMKTVALDPEEKGLVYKKNEPIMYSIHYFDYENDPVKKEYWKYSHIPFVDGGAQHPQAAAILDKNGTPVKITGTILSKPLSQIDVEGKYIVEHWVEDNTSRVPHSMGTSYDKLSNVETLTFYVEGGEAAPWINSIKTVPGIVGEGDEFYFEIEVDDSEKDTLSVIAELYFNRRLVFSYGENNIKANASGKYPTIVTDVVPFSAEKGAYELVVTATDASSAGIGSLRFRVKPTIEAYIHHTTQWDENRIQYNLSKPTGKSDSPRGYNTFWSGEKFLIEAFVADNPGRVTVEIENYPEYEAVMAPSGIYNADGSELYTATLWDSTMVNRWGNQTPQILTFIFTAEYGSPLNLNRIKTTSIIVDNRDQFWRPQRQY
jgi:hypothetical protein